MESRSVAKKQRIFFTLPDLGRGREKLIWKCDKTLFAFRQYSSVRSFVCSAKLIDHNFTKIRNGTVYIAYHAIMGMPHHWLVRRRRLVNQVVHKETTSNWNQFNVVARWLWVCPGIRVFDIIKPGPRRTKDPRKALTFIATGQKWYNDGQFAKYVFTKNS